MPITIEQAKQLTCNDTIHANDYFNSNGTCQRYRVNGKIQLWKTRPKEFRLPIKRGLREYYQLTDYNCHLFHLIESCPQNQLEFPFPKKFRK